MDTRLFEKMEFAMDTRLFENMEFPMDTILFEKSCALLDLYFYGSLWPVANTFIRARGAGCVVSSIVFFSNHVPCLKRDRVGRLYMRHLGGDGLNNQDDDRFIYQKQNSTRLKTASGR